MQLIADSGPMADQNKFNVNVIRQDPGIPLDAGQPGNGVVGIYLGDRTDANPPEPGPAPADSERFHYPLPVQRGAFG